jgi:hypothetical protein
MLCLVACQVEGPLVKEDGPLLTDKMESGETKTYTVDGVDYEITMVAQGETAIVSVNGEETDPLERGEAVDFYGLIVKVESVYKLGAKRYVEFSLFVE